MDYSTSRAECPPQLHPVEKAYLDCLPILVERAEMVRKRLDGFTERFNGPASATANKEAFPPGCHRTLLDRLSSILADIAEITVQIERIG